MKRINAKFIAVIIAIIVLVPVACYGQFGFGGIVYDPTNYGNAVLRYRQLIEQLAQLQQTYSLAVQMSKNLQNMPARYRATFSQWRAFTAADLYGNTTAWVNAANGEGAQTVSPAYQRATVPLLTYSQADLDAINPADARTLESAYASLELADGANVSTLATVGNVRADAQAVQQQIANLEQDSLSADPSLNTELGVLNKINATNVLTLRSVQDANNMRLAALEQQLLSAKQQRDTEAANINFSIQIHQEATQNLAPFNTNLAESLDTYRLP